MLCHWIPHPNFSCVACGYKLASNEKQSIYSDTKIKGPCPQQKAKPYFLYCLNQSVKYTTIIAVITMTFLTDGIFFKSEMLDSATDWKKQSHLLWTATKTLSLI